MRARENVIQFKNAPGDSKLLRGDVNLVMKSATAVLVLPMSQGGGTFTVNGTNIDNNSPCE